MSLIERYWHVTTFDFKESIPYDLIMNAKSYNVYKTDIIDILCSLLPAKWNHISRRQL